MDGESKTYESLHRDATEPEAGDIAQRSRGAPETHGLYKLARAVDVLGGRGLKGISARSAVGKALRRWEAELVADLGGNPSTQQRAIIELAVRTRLLLSSVDAWLFAQPSILNRRKRSLLPVVTQRQVLADALARYLGQLGLARRTGEVVDAAGEIARMGKDDDGR